MTELHQCPCCQSTKCMMDEPCLGCETYSEWVRESKKVWYTVDDDGKKHFTGDDWIEGKTDHGTIMISKHVSEIDVISDIDRSHEECAYCALEKSDPPKCSGHMQGPVSCSSFQEAK